MSDRVLPPDRDFQHTIEDIYNRLREMERRLGRCSCEHGVKLRLNKDVNRPMVVITDKDNEDFGSQFVL